MDGNKTVKAVIVFAGGRRAEMDFPGWAEYVQYLEAHYGAIEETSGKMEN